MLKRTALLVALATAGCVTASRPLAVVPFDFVKNQILVPVTIKSRGPFTMLLDTAVTPSVVSADLVRELGLPLDTSKTGEASGAGEGPGLEIQQSSISQLNVGGIAAGDIDALATDTSSFSKRLGRPLQGILGQSFLEGRVVEIDYPARVVRIFDSRTALPRRPDDVRLPMEFAAADDITPIIPIEVNGRTIPVSLDTGSSLTLSIYPHAVTELGLEVVRAKATASDVLGARGKASVAEAEVDSLGIGALVIMKPRITFGRKPQDEVSRRKGNLGNGFLQNFVLTLDYPRREITLRKPRA